MKSRPVFLVILLNIILCFNAQGQVLFEKSFASYVNSADGVCLADSDGIAVVGTANDSAWGDWDFSIIKINTSGNLIFAKRYSNTVFWDEATDIISVSDGGYLVTIYSDSIASDGFIEYPGIVRIDELGNVMWSKKMITEMPAHLFSSYECQNGDFIFGGKQEGDFSIGTDAIIMRTDHNGNLIWTKKMGVSGYGNETFNQVIEISDSDIIAVGNTPIGVGAGDFFVARYNSAGDSLWTKIYGTPGSDFGYCISETANGNFYISGSVNFFSISRKGFFVAKIDGQGTLIMDNILGLDYKCVSYQHIELSSGDLIFTGEMVTSGGGVLDGFIAITDPLGNFQAATGYPEPGLNELKDIVRMEDSIYVLAGTNSVYQVNGLKASILKINPYDLRSCSGDSLQFSDTSVNFVQNVSSSMIAMDNPFIYTSKPYVPIDMPIADTTICEYGSTASVESEIYLTDFRIYPNPANEEVTILSEDKIRLIELYDLHGNKVMQTNDPHFTISILNPGIYVVVIYFQNEVRGVGKIIRT